MGTLALADVLIDFGTRPTGPAPEIHVPVRPTATPPMDVDALVREAVATAEAALAERLALEHAAALEEAVEAERKRGADALEAALGALGSEAGETIAARLDAHEERLRTFTAEVVGRILGSMLSEELRERSLAALADAVRTAAGDREAVRIEVRGPRLLFDTLAQALGERAAAVTFIEAEGFDLTVSVDGDLFETRLAEWSAALSEILA